MKKVRRLQHAWQCENPSAVTTQSQRLHLNKCDAEEESNRSKVWLICWSFGSVCVFDKQRGDVRVGLCGKREAATWGKEDKARHMTVTQRGSLRVIDMIQREPLEVTATQITEHTSSLLPLTTTTEAHLSSERSVQELQVRTLNFVWICQMRLLLDISHLWPKVLHVLWSFYTLCVFLHHPNF